MKSLIAALLALVAMPVAAAPIITDWDAGSGLLPSQVTPSWTLSGATPGFSASGAMMLSGYQSFAQEPGAPVGFDTERAFAVEASLRYVSGDTRLDSREGVVIGFTQQGSFGNGLFIGNGRIFINSDNVVRGATAAVDTAGFHRYRLAVSSPTDGGRIEVYYDDVLTLTGATFNSLPANGDAPRFYFGGGSYYASATSEWQYVRDYAPGVPEPASWALLVTGFALTGVAARRGRYRRV